MAEPTIVYVTSKLPYPLRSGLALRQFHLLEAYASIGRVALVFFDQEPDDAIGRDLDAEAEALAAETGAVPA